MRRTLREGKAQLELAVTKCLTGAKLTPAELTEVSALCESDLMRSFGCDLYMAETVKLHAKKEMMRLRAQNQFTKMDGLQNGNGYPKKPFTRTEYVQEPRKRLKEDRGEGRMMDYGHTKSDSEEGRMMKQFLRDMAVDAYRLHQMLEDGDDLPEWCHYKVAQAQGMMQSIRNYLEYKLERAGEDDVGEAEMFDPEEMEEDFGSGEGDGYDWEDDSDDLDNEGYDDADFDVAMKKDEDEE